MSARLSEVSTVTKEEIIDALQNYEIIEEIGRGTKSIVHLAICKKGRLRNRKVALKEIHDSSSDISASIQQNLHHPSVVSLFSVFSTSSATYHVLEYCAYGNLSEFLRSGKVDVPLEDSQIRGIFKNVVEALIYLSKNSDSRQRLVPKSLLVTESYRVKFKSRTPSVCLSSKISSDEDSNYSPSGRLPQDAHNFFEDVWSLGCLALMCLTGRPLFEDDSQKSFGKTKTSSYDIPDTASYKLKDLISALLQTTPEDRISLYDILSHPFFHHALPIQSLGLSMHESPINSVENSKITLFTRKPLREILNLNQSETHFSYRQPGNLDKKPGRRVVSDPVTGSNVREKFLDPERPKVRFRPCSIAVTPSFLGGPRRTKENHDEKLGHLKSDQENLMDSELIDEFEEALQSPSDHSKFASKKQMDPFASTPNNVNGFSVPLQEMVLPRLQPQSQQYPATFGVPRPTKFNTLCITPQTQKVSRGQLTILPSRSILVDFREGERRKGRAGSEVLLISPDGSIVKVYSAPHLSAPCCLAEPTVVYPLDDLPPSYWKQYNDSSAIIEQIKQHVPKLVLYDIDARCTLMANEPEADVELLFYSDAHDSVSEQLGKKIKSGYQVPYMRIQLSRRRNLAEISRKILWPSKKTLSDDDKLMEGEWRKRVLVAPGGNFSIVDYGALEVMERNGMERAIAFVSLCDTVDKLTTMPAERDMPAKVVLAESTASDSSRSRSPASAVVESPLRGDDVSKEALSKNASLPARVYPPKSSLLERSVIQQSMSSSPTYEGFETRFIPSVGWCVRYGPSGDAGKYKMMFFDGAVLEVDVDGECVEFLNSITEEVERYDIRDCSSKRNVMDRMKAFKEFVSMFDDRSGSM